MDGRQKKEAVADGESCTNLELENVKLGAFNEVCITSALHNPRPCRVLFEVDFKNSSREALVTCKPDVPWLAVAGDVVVVRVVVDGCRCSRGRGGNGGGGKDGGGGNDSGGGWT